MFRIFGNITVKETGEGIPNLVVAVFDTDQAQLDLGTARPPDFEGAWRDRIGSVLTADSGRFELTFEKADFQLGDQEERPDLMLVVFAPEDSRSPNEPSPLAPHERVLHVSRVPRQDAGRTEAYSIRLLKAQLDRFDISVGGDQAASDPGRYVAAVLRTWDFQDEVKKELQPRLKQEAETAQALARAVKEKFKDLSAVPRARREQDPLFVATPKTLSAAQNTAIEGGLERLSKYRGLLRVTLSEADIDRLNAANGEGGEHILEVIDGHVEGETDASALFAIVSERSGGMDRVRSRSLIEACVPPEHTVPTTGDGTLASQAALIPLSRIARAAAPGDSVHVAVRVENARGLPQPGIDVQFGVTQGGGLISPAIARSNSEGKVEARWILGTSEGPQTLTVTAVGTAALTFTVATSESSAELSTEGAERRLLQRVIGQVQEMEAAEAAETLPPRPDQEKVQEAVQSLKLEGGPADATAYRDFHVLQIAFKHVWAEAFDERLRRQAELLFDEVVEIAKYVGVEDDVLTAEIESLEDLIALAEEGAAAYQTAAGVHARAPDVPASVVVAFPEIEVERWVELWREMTREEQDTVLRATLHGALRYAADLAIADASVRLVNKKARAPVTSEAPADDATVYFPRLRRLLGGVKERMAEPYAFDIFAPNSYNFGIMTTYRQKWEPLSYQAGDLVATIPLAPGETRKFTKKEVVKKSRAEKEIAKAMSSRSEELSATRRAEAEIMRKASTATNFKHTAEGSFSIGIADISGSTEFALNQAEESASNKKDFRESTLKAAEEYKRERELQVETTSSEEIETTTSGEISNPNNELTVTYLFYELQRRYRISEHVHRLRPVVLVAQAVPAPNEIDEDWLLARVRPEIDSAPRKRGWPAALRVPGQLHCDGKSPSGVVIWAA